MVSLRALLPRGVSGASRVFIRISFVLLLQGQENLHLQGVCTIVYMAPTPRAVCPREVCTRVRPYDCMTEAYFPTANDVAHACLPRGNPKIV